MAALFPGGTDWMAAKIERTVADSFSDMLWAANMIKQPESSMDLRVLSQVRIASAVAAIIAAIGLPNADAQPEGFNYDESGVPEFELPDPLITEDGRRVDSVLVWEQVRRPEILRLFEHHVYGTLPDLIVRLRVRSHGVSRVLDGLALREQQTVYLTDRDDGPSVDLLIYTPADAPLPVPAILGLNFRGNHTVDADPDIRLPTSWVPNDKKQGIMDHRASEASRGARARRWDIEAVVFRGYGLVTAYYGDVDPDYDDSFHNGIHQLAKTDRTAESGGSISAWAWGLSRILDTLETHPRVDGRRVAVFGHSRLGKTALWAGATDERFRLVISNNSGCGGAALARRRFGETVKRINTEFPHWFCRRHHEYNDREDDLHVDQHQLMALIAPRPVYVASAVNDVWADPQGEMLSLFHASPVYALYGRTGLNSSALPEPGQAVMKDVGYHIRPGRHDVTSYDWARYLDFADRHLR